MPAGKQIRQILAITAELLTNRLPIFTSRFFSEASELQ